MTKKILTYRLSDNSAQLTFFKGLSPNDKPCEIPLYIGFAQEEIHFLHGKAMYESIQSLNAMKPKKYLDEWFQQRHETPRPSSFPQLGHLNGVILWGMIAQKLVEKAISYAGSYGFTCEGLIISIPDLIDPSLKQLIVNAFEHCKSLYKNMLIKIITHSIALPSMILTDELRGMSKVIVSRMSELYTPHLLGVLDYSFNSTDMYVILVKDKTGIVVNKGRVDIGFSTLIEQMSFLVGNTGKELKPIDKWTKSEMEFARGLKKDFNNFCNQNMSSVNIEKGGDTIRIEREDAESYLEDSNKEICKMAKRTIDEAIALLKQIGEIEIEGQMIDTKSLAFQVCLTSCETKNPFLADMLMDSFNIDLKDGNNNSHYVLYAASYYTRMIEHQLGIETKEQTSNPTLFEMNISEIIHANRFIVKDNYGKEILRFPEYETVSNEMVEIDNHKLQPDVEYHLIDTMDKKGYEYEIGSFFITERGVHTITFHNTIGTIESGIEICDGDEKDSIPMKDMIWKQERGEYQLDYEVTKHFISYGDIITTHLEMMNGWNRRYQDALTIRNKSNALRKQLMAIDALPQIDIQDNWKNIQNVYENDPKGIETACQQFTNEQRELKEEMYRRVDDI